MTLAIASEYFSKFILLYFVLWISTSVTNYCADANSQKSTYPLTATCENGTREIHANICRRPLRTSNKDCISLSKFKAVVKKLNDCQLSIVRDDDSDKPSLNNGNNDILTPGDDSARKHIWKRQLRDPGGCDALKPPKPGKVICKIFWREIDCIGVCDMGYRFIDGTYRKVHRCFDEGPWIPAPTFPPCKPMCIPNCQNGGRCIDINTCSCPKEYRGEMCQYPLSLCSISKTQSASSWLCNHTKLGSTCKVSCYAPGTLEADLEARLHFCTIQGTWKPILPTCVSPLIVGICRHPGRVQNGIMHNKDGGDIEIFSAGKMLFFSCQEGYQMEGEASIYCQSDSSWSAAKPICTKKAGLSFCGISKTMSASSWQCNRTKLGNRCKISCHPPGTVEAETEGRFYFCSNDGVWHPPHPRCVTTTVVGVCPNPGTVQNSVMYKEGNDNSEIFYPGTRLFFSCKEGYLLEGEASIYCQSGGSWSSLKPICTKKTIEMCLNPGILLNGKVHSEEGDTVLFSPGKKLVFSCQEGYQLEGEENIYCQPNGSWSASNPICTKKTDSCFHITSSQHEVRVFFPDTEGLRMSLLLNKEDNNGDQNMEKDDTAIKSFPIGTKIQYKCRSRFYNLYGSEYQTCQPSGIWSGNKPVCLPNCGKAEAPRKPLIVGGQASEVGMWPWQVALSVYRLTNNAEEEPLAIVCGGALISEIFVLTAAHCVAIQYSTSPLPTGAVVAHLGKHFRNSARDDQHVQTRKIRRIVIHEDYDFVKFEADIALLELESIVELTTRIQPICLPTETSARDNLRSGQLGVVTGWGLTEEGGYSNELRETVLSIVSREDCEESYHQGLRSIVVSERMMCAGGGPSDTCSGDSGGPFAFLDPISSRTWVLEGIVSWGSGAGCGRTREYSGFTKVIRFVDWIKSYL